MTPLMNLCHARRREEHLAISAAMLFSRFELDAVEALLDGAGALVRRQNALALHHHGARDARQLAAIHRASSAVGRTGSGLTGRSLAAAKQARKDSQIELGRAH